MPSQAQLMEIIKIQTEVAKPGHDLGGVMALVVERTLPLIQADGAAIELAEGEDMVYRAASGIAQGYLGLRLKRASSLSGLGVHTGETLRSDDTDNDPRVNREACCKVDLPEAVAIQRFHDGIRPPFLFEGRVYHLSASMGAAQFPEDSSDLLHLLEVADQRMYQVKREHHKRNTVLN